MTRKEMERQARNHYKAWERSGDYALESVYGRYSVEKARAWRHCQEKAIELNGSELKVITHSCTKFTAGFVYWDTKTGVAMFYYISPSFNCSIEITADML